MTCCPRQWAQSAFKVKSTHTTGYDVEPKHSEWQKSSYLSLPAGVRSGRLISIKRWELQSSWHGRHSAVETTVITDNCRTGEDKRGIPTIFFVLWKSTVQQRATNSRPPSRDTMSCSSPFWRGGEAGRAVGLHQRLGEQRGVLLRLSSSSVDYWA